MNSPQNFETATTHKTSKIRVSAIRGSYFGAWWHSWIFGDDVMSHHSWRTSAKTWLQTFNSDTAEHLKFGTQVGFCLLFVCVPQTYSWKGTILKGTFKIEHLLVHWGVFEESHPLRWTFPSVGKIWRSQLGFATPSMVGKTSKQNFLPKGGWNPWRCIPYGAIR